MQVVVVSAASSPATAEIVDELGRESMTVQQPGLEVLDTPPEALVYLVPLVLRSELALGARFVEWAPTGPLRAGLIGIVVDGRPEDREAVLELGFDDVVVTPVSSREMVARVRAMHRRVVRKPIVSSHLRFGDVTLDLHQCQLWIGAAAIGVTSKERGLLRAMINARGRPLSRAQLLDAVWGEGELEITERAVDNAILRLRRKLPAGRIETVRSVGFRIVARR